MQEIRKEHARNLQGTCKKSARNLQGIVDITLRVMSHRGSRSTGSAWERTACEALPRHSEDRSRALHFGRNTLMLEIAHRRPLGYTQHGLINPHRDIDGASHE
jgi:hypothetical protein